MPEELHNHRPDIPYRQRYAAAAERVQALRVIWSHDEPAFDGRWDRFERSWVHPKPVQSVLPIGFGSSGELGMRYAADLADEWYPIDALLSSFGGVGAGVARFHEMLVDAGREPSAVPITVFAWGWEPGTPSLETIRGYADLGVDRVVICPPSMARHSADLTSAASTNSPPSRPCGDPTTAEAARGQLGVCERWFLASWEGVRRRDDGEPMENANACKRGADERSTPA